MSLRYIEKADGWRVIVRRMRRRDRWAGWALLAADAVVAAIGFRGGLDGEELAGGLIAVPLTAALGAWLAFGYQRIAFDPARRQLHASYRLFGWRLPFSRRQLALRGSEVLTVTLQVIDDNEGRSEYHHLTVRQNGRRVNLMQFGERDDALHAAKRLAGWTGLSLVPDGGAWERSN